MGLMWADYNTSQCGFICDTLDVPQTYIHNCTDHKEIMIINTMTHSSVLAVQLLIGNVEANPGPIDAITYMAELIANVDDESIRKVLQQFKTTQDRKVNIQKVETMKNEDLKATLAHINNWDPEDELVKNDIKTLVKSGLAEKIVRRLENVLPDTCSTCTKPYYFHISDVNLLTCVKCDRGVCPNCFATEKQQLEQTHLFRSSIFFICTSCVQTVKSEAALKEHCFRKHKNMNTNVDPKEKEEEEVIDLEDNEDDIAADDTETNTKDDLEDSSDDPKAKDENHTKPKICFFFTRFNNCKHGISGKGCKFEHPKTCYKFTKYGNGRYGCSRGENCKFFHPKLCKGSLAKTKVCTNDNCKFVHLKGTKRSEVSSTSSTRKTVRNKESFLGQGQMKQHQRAPPGRGLGTQQQPQNQQLRQTSPQMAQKHQQLQPPPQMAQIHQQFQTTPQMTSQPQMMTLMLQMMNQMMAQQQQTVNQIGLVPTYASMVQRSTV